MPALSEYDEWWATGFSVLMELVTGVILSVKSGHIIDIP